MSNANSIWKLRLCTFVIAVMLGIAALELFAWGIYLKRQDIRDIFRGMESIGQSHIDPYEVIDPEIMGHWRLRPNYSASGQMILKEKRVAGKWLGAAAVQENLNAGNPIALKINSAGYKGPEIDESHRCTRVLALGDSVTFGIGGLSYPTVMRSAFEKADVNVEVINAGVEGYSPQNLLNELPRYLALQPEFVTIYIGWNAIFDTDLESIRGPSMLKSMWLINNAAIALNRILGDANTQATKSYKRELRPDAGDPVIKDIGKHTPAYFDEIKELISAFRAVDTQVYLITLMGLFQVDQIPSAKAMKIGHLPRNTDNPYVLASLTQRHNTLLREKAAQDGVYLVDLQKWGRSQLRPIEKYFFDSVHFNAVGLQKVGKFIASKMAKPIQENAKSYTCIESK